MFQMVPESRVPQEKPTFDPHASTSSCAGGWCLGFGGWDVKLVVQALGLSYEPPQAPTAYRSQNRRLYYLDFSPLP